MHKSLGPENVQLLTGFIWLHNFRNKGKTGQGIVSEMFRKCACSIHCQGHPTYLTLVARTRLGAGNEGTYCHT